MNKNITRIALLLLIMTLILLSVLALVLGKGQNHRAKIPFSTEVTAEDALQLHEIMSSNKNTLLPGMTKLTDWIELANDSQQTLSLKGYAVMRADDPTSLTTFGDVSIPPMSFALLIADGKSSQTHGDEIHLPFKLPSAGCTVVLMNPAGQVIDSVEVPKLEADCVYARDAAKEWHISTTATPLSANALTDMPVEQSQTERALTVAQDQVIISEIMASNASYAADPQGKFHDYVEITNNADFDVNLKDWMLSDDKTKPAKWTFPDVTVRAHEALLVYCSGADDQNAQTNDALQANFRLSGDGCQVLLSRSDGQCIAFIEVPVLEKDQAYSFVNGSWTTTFAPTPGMANTAESVARQDSIIRTSNVTGVLINEIAAAKTSEEYDWIELYNAGANVIDLSGYGLSDNAARPRKWQFPQGTQMFPGSLLLVYCSGLDTVRDGKLHTSFKLGAEGGYAVTLSDPSGNLIDRVYLPTQTKLMSYGRTTAGTLGFFDAPTPMGPNAATVSQGRASKPTYSVPGGLYTTGDVLDVELKASDPSARIYYTLDNTDPTESSLLYTQPIHITGTTILRTRVYADNCLASYMDTQSYLYDVNNGDGVYTVSLVSDPYNLTSEEAGIMILGSKASKDYPYKGANFWQDWEREAHIEIYDGEGNPILTEGCGIKLHGQFSRAENQQAFKVYARSKYGAGRFDAALFSNRPYTSYNSFLLRSSGQDTNLTRMRDSVLTSLAGETSVMYQESEVCVLYLDGQYWGQYYLREHISTSSICQFEDWVGQEDDLDLVKANKNVMQGSNDTYAEMVEYAKNCDPTQDSFYEYIDQRIDIQNYIEYMSLEIFTGNGDTLNVKRYRNPKADGKWRWVLFDLDWAFFVDTDSINRWLSPGGMGTNKYTDNSFFINCMKNPRFRDEFLTYFGERMTDIFTTEHMMDLFEARYTILKPLLPDQLARWEQSEESHQNAVKKLTDYCKTRPGRLLEFFAGTQYLGMTDADMEKYFGDARRLINGDD